MKLQAVLCASVIFSMVQFPEQPDITLGSWPAPVLSSSVPRCTKGEARGRSQKKQVLTHDGDENRRPLQVRQRERHNVYWQIVQPYQQLKRMPSISTSLPCISRVTSYQHQERDLGELGALLADQFSEVVQVCLYCAVHSRSLAHGCFILVYPVDCKRSCLLQS